MEVILIEPVRHLGKIGELKDVKTGYGRNYLIPKKLAIRATENNKLFIESQKQYLEEKNDHLFTEAKKIASILQDKDLFFVKQTSEDGRLFGSVNNKEIAKNLMDILQATDSSIEYKISATQVSLTNPLKTIGFSSCKVSIHPEIIIDVNLSIGRTEIEAQDLLRIAKMNIATVNNSESESS